MNRDSTTPLGTTETRWLDTWARIIDHLVPMIREVEKDREEIASVVRGKPAKGKYFSDVSVESEWWRYYELSERRHVAIALIHVGLVSGTIQKIIKGILRRDLLTPLLKELPEVEIEPVSPRRTLGAAWSLGNTLRAYVIAGRSLNQLVASAETSEGSLRLAVRIDPLTMYCKPIRRRVARAAAQHDSLFFTRLGEALQNPKTIQSEQYPELQASLFLLERAKQLGFLNEARAEQLFLLRLKHLRLYDSDRRSLIRYVQRFRDRKTDIS